MCINVTDPIMLHYVPHATPLVGQDGANDILLLVEKYRISRLNAGLYYVLISNRRPKDDHVNNDTSVNLNVVKRQVPRLAPPSPI